MKSTVIKRSVVVGRHRTSISLEDAFWRDLKDVAHAQECTISELIERSRGAAKRQPILGDPLFVLEHFRAKSNITARAKGQPLATAS